MYRNRDLFEDSSNEFRITSQLNIKGVGDHLRVGHRFRIEQRFFTGLTVHRLRYRIALDLPLNGYKLDLGEFYLTSATSLLWNISKDIPELDNRTSVQIGWFYSKSLKLQIGLEHRFNEINRASNHDMFLLTSAIFKI
jgi:hypothetical protein